MLKKLARTLGIATFLLSTTSQALPIVQADAFVAGDNKAALQTSTGLVWMDFGVNNHIPSFKVVDLLATDYAGWRLPTESEAMAWINDLAGNIGWRAGYGSFKYLDLPDNTHFDYLATLTDIIGFDRTSTATLHIGGVLVNTYLVNTLDGSFAMNTGKTGVFSLASALDNAPNARSSGYFYVEDMTFPSVNGTTLLVKDTAKSVPEPSSLVLGLFALLALAYRRKLVR